MPVGIGWERPESRRRGVVVPARTLAPRGFHPGALWLAAAAPVVATLIVLARMAA